jgi:uncharacterized protein involved in cysteine biosynthesis
VKPCPICGYETNASACPHCRGAPREASLAGPPPRGLAAIWAGARALPRGFGILLTTRRTKRLLFPPLVLTIVLYSIGFLVAWRLGASTWRAHVVSEPWRTLAEAGTFVVAAIVFAFVFAWTFTIVYQVVATPFYDAIQGRVEARWFGADPRATIVRAREAGLTTTKKWLLFSRDQTRSLIVSLEASVVALLILLLFVWILLIPFVGSPTFGAVAGFASAIALLDIPFSRREWPLSRRLRFVFTNIGAVTALGLATSLVFLVPFAGPIVGLPSASIGGQWLLVRLDKSRL